MTKTTQQPSNTLRRILAVLAHPDDEAFGMGGTLAFYASRGVEVYLACATLGEAGIIPEGFLGEGQSVADLRASELDCSAKNLGLKEVIKMGYRDSGMLGWPDNTNPNALINQALETVVDHVAEIIKQIQPDVVLTFDPIGGYRHPDHIRVHEATVRAFANIRASNSNTNAPKALYFHTIPNGLVKAMVWTLRLRGKNPRKFGDKGDINLEDIANQNFPTHARINFKSMAYKQIAASACHASQNGITRGTGVQSFLMGLVMRPVDRFMQAYPETKPGQPCKRDLFEGLS
jgi:N-acetyl-1-D-myo-inositol-2-amino-2-deoxy-alpha-D-glucopyranoside deacetylase